VLSLTAADQNQEDIQMIGRLRSLAAALLLLPLTVAVSAAETPGSDPVPQENGTLYGRVSPPIVGAQILIQPSEGGRQITLRVADDGGYKATLPPGQYYVLPSVKGYDLAGDLPGYGALVSVKAGEETAVPDFTLTETGTLVGHLLDADRGTVVLARRRSLDLPEYDRFWRKASVSPVDGGYYLEGLRPGTYDLRIVSPTKGMVDVRQPLAAPDTLSDQDRALIRALESSLADAIRSADGDRVLACYATDYRMPTGYTYQAMKEAINSLKVHPERALLPAEKAAPNANQVLGDWKRSVLALQGSGDHAVGIVHNSQLILVRSLREPGSPATPSRNTIDFLITYRKIDGAWKIASEENIRSYRDLQGRIAMITETPPKEMKPLPDDFAIKYVLEPDTESLTVYSRKVTTAHDYRMGAEASGKP
jgi:hypothetical protein